jgi:phosphoribosylanthranilate isomerase
VIEAIETAHPYAVDVSSGVELEPGKKDHDKLRAFLMATKGLGADHRVRILGKKKWTTN